MDVERERRGVIGYDACTFTPWDRDVNRMHQRQQGSRAVTVFRRAGGLASETVPMGTEPRLTNAGGRNVCTSTLPTRAVKRRSLVDHGRAAGCVASPRSATAAER